MENFRERADKHDFVINEPGVEHRPVSAEKMTESQDDVWADLQQYAAKNLPAEDNIMSAEELAAMPEGQSMAVLKMEAIRQLKGFERIQAIGGIEKYLDDTEEKWQGKRSAMEAQSSRKIEELGGVLGKVKRMVSSSRRHVWTTANEIQQAIKVVDTYRARKKELLDRKKAN